MSDGRAALRVYFPVMTIKRLAGSVALLAFLFAGLGARSRAADAGLDAAFQKFWDAPTPAIASAAADSLAASGIAFDEAFTRLRAGRPYSKAAPTGVVRNSRRDGELEFFYSVNVPPDYDPSREYPVRFQLHGGVTAPEDNRPRGTGAVGALAGDGRQIYILPTGWVDAPWWSERQVKNLHEILDAVKRAYNVDENRVVVSGVSDGGTAAFYVAMHDTTPYASFLPLNGFLMVLRNRALVLEDLFPNNLVNKPFFIVNGGLDRLYPTSLVDPVVRYLRNGGVTVDYRPQPNGVHNTAWWPEVKAPFEQFVREHPRNPLPETLTWQRGEDDPFTRAHWLVVDRLGGADSDRPLADVNLVPMPPTREFGATTIGTRVTTVLHGSNAEAIGLRAGDVLVSVNDEDVPSGADFDQMLTHCCKAGARMQMVVSRNSHPVQLTGTYDPMSSGESLRLFQPRRRSGRVDLVKAGNTVRATTRGVSEYTLLLSPDAFDFAKPVTVITNGTVSFEGKVERSVSTLLKWAAADNDRTMLFGAELHVKVN